MKIKFIKFLLIILSLAILNVAKAQTIIQESGKKYSEIFDSLATGLIPSRIPYGNLNDRTAGWSGLAEWQSNDTLSTTQLIQSWYDIEQSYFDSLQRPNRYVNMRTKMQEKIHAVNLATC